MLCRDLDNESISELLKDGKNDKNWDRTCILDQVSRGISNFVSLTAVGDILPSKYLSIDIFRRYNVEGDEFKNLAEEDDASGCID